MSELLREITAPVNLRSSEFPTTADAWNVYRDCDEWRWEKEGDSAYGYVVAATRLITSAGVFHLRPGMYFAAPAPVAVRGGSGLVIVRHGFRSLFSVGGPIEPTGRLRYIDGCTDTLLIGPPRAGDPCLNHLHFPPNIVQTMHTHPSVRIGCVARGRGECVTPSTRIPLRPGMCWHLPVDSPHCFYTYRESMDIVAWHPDSDTGPRDEDHPMINRTLVDGVSASQIDSIRTPE